MKILIIASFTDSLINFRGPMLTAMRDAGHDVHTCAPEASSDQVTALAKLGVTFHQIDLNRAGLNPFADYKTYKSIKDLCHTLKPDKVLSYTIKPVMYGSLAAHAAGIKNIYSMVTGLGYVFTGNSLKHKQKE